MTKNSIITNFKKYVGTDDYSDWYVGITNDIDRRLFCEHKVDKKQDKWIHNPANGKDVAQEVEEYFLNKGMDGDTGSGNDDTTHVYALQEE